MIFIRKFSTLPRIVRAFILALCLTLMIGVITPIIMSTFWEIGLNAYKCSSPVQGLDFFSLFNSLSEFDSCFGQNISISTNIVAIIIMIILYTIPPTVIIYSVMYDIETSTLDEPKLFSLTLKNEIYFTLITNCTNEEILFICYDYFPEVYKQLSHQLEKDQIIRLLIQHVGQKNQLGKLFDIINQPRYKKILI